MHNVDNNWDQNLLNNCKPNILHALIVTVSLFKNAIWRASVTVAPPQPAAVQRMLGFEFTYRLVQPSRSIGKEPQSKLICKFLISKIYNTSTYLVKTA